MKTGALLCAKCRSKVPSRLSERRRGRWWAVSGQANVGSGKGNSVGAVLGSVAGGVAGSAIGEGVTCQAGLEITVRFDDGRMIAVTQAADEKFQPGERVLTGDGVIRISH